MQIHSPDVVFERVLTGYTAWSNTSKLVDQLNMPIIIIIEQQGDCLAYTTFNAAHVMLPACDATTSLDKESHT